MAGIKLKHVYQKYDYSYYLGPDYEETQKKYKHASTIVANHTNMHDQSILSLSYTPTFIASIFNKVGIHGFLFKVA